MEDIDIINLHEGIARFNEVSFLLQNSCIINQVLIIETRITLSRVNEFLKLYLYRDENGKLYLSDKGFIYNRMNSIYDIDSLYNCFFEVSLDDNKNFKERIKDLAGLKESIKHFYCIIQKIIIKDKTRSFVLEMDDAISKRFIHLLIEPKYEKDLAERTLEEQRTGYFEGEGSFQIYYPGQIDCEYITGGKMVLYLKKPLKPRLKIRLEYDEIKEIKPKKIIRNKDHYYMLPNRIKFKDIQAWEIYLPYLSFEKLKRIIITKED